MSEIEKFVKYWPNGKKWLETPGKKGQKHNVTNMRYWRDEDNKYLDRWDLLGLD